MMGRLKHDQGRLFYSFCLEEAVPEDHLVRQVAAVLDLSWVHGELAPHYPDNGRPSIDPELMIRMLIIGYVFAIRSERALCRDVQVNLQSRRRSSRRRRAKACGSARLARLVKNRSLPALKAFPSSRKNSRRNSRASTRTGRRKPGRQVTQRVPSSEGPPPGTTQWTCG